MGFAQILRLKHRYSIQCAAGMAVIVLLAPACRAQVKTPAGAASPAETADKPWLESLKKYPGLVPEFGKLVEKLKQNVQFPPARTESHLVALLPESTMSYAAFSNYGDAAQQALKVFREELQESTVLREWWQHGDLATAGPKVEDSLEKFAQLHQYLGEEIAVAGSAEGKESSFLVVAEVRKPGLKKFLQETISHFAEGVKPGVRVLDVQELGTAKDNGSPQDLILLVRTDFVVAGFDLATLRKFNGRLDRGGNEFVSTPFGQRIVKEYVGGVTLLAAADLQKIVNQVPPEAKENAAFQGSGFADVKYLVWEHKSVAGRDVSQTELSFKAPRHGSAAWLAKSRPLSNLDFVSPKAMVAGTLVLANPPQIFDDVKELYGASSSSPFATIESFEKILKLNLKDDLLRTLGGEITVELDSVTPPKPVWRVILSVRDASHLQQTLTTLLATGHIEVQPFADGGVAYYSVPVPSSPTPFEIGYAIVDGHLIVASSRETVAEAVRQHRVGESLGKSKLFLAAMPPDHELEASALLYQDPMAMTTMQLRQIAPEMAESIARISKEATPTVVCVYGEESSIRETSSNGAFDLGAGLVVAAVAIPNLLRSRTAANEASAVGSIRTVNIAQVTYGSRYEDRGYAPNLAALGGYPSGPARGTLHHAGLIDASLGNDSCTGDAWCTKNGYRFRVTTACKQLPCKEYLVTASPVDTNAGIRNFCSTSDGVIRYKTGESITPPTAVAECKAWTPLQ
jgi:type IV pilus assembly protein PilA